MQQTFKPISYQDHELRILNQTKLPTIEQYENYRDYFDMVDAIRHLKVRGAPLLGVMTAYGISVTLNNSGIKSMDEMVEYYKKIRQEFYQTRPTARNLSYALQRLDRIVFTGKYQEVIQLQSAIKEEALAIHREDKQACLDMAKNAYEKLFYKKDHYNFISHCNAGSLATGGIGTSLGVIKYLHHMGKSVHVYVDETRPLLQGSRLTAWELSKNRIPYTVITDSMAGMIMSKYEIDAVLVGADRIAANGDSANKIGTLPLSIIARHFNVPFYVVAPHTTFDLTLKEGGEIPIEKRSEREVIRFMDIETAPLRSATENYAFDVTPYQLITGIVTEKGIYSMPLNQK